MNKAYDPRAAAIFVGYVASVLLLLSANISRANICVEEKPKPLRRVTGVVLDLYDRPIPDAKVEILKGGVELSAVRSGEDGKFSFGQLDAGNYEVRAQAPGFNSIEFYISVVKPKASGRRVVQIHLDLGIVERCPHVRIIKSKPAF